MQDKSYIFTFSMKNFLPFEVLRSSVKTLDFFFPLANSVIVFLLYVVLYFVTIGLRLFFPARLNEFRILWESFFGGKVFFDSWPENGEFTGEFLFIPLHVHANGTTFSGPQWRSRLDGVNDLLSVGPVWGLGQVSVSEPLSQFLTNTSVRTWIHFDRD